MAKESNILVSVEKLFQSQSIVKKNILLIIKLTIVLGLLVFIAGFIVSWQELPKVKAEKREFNKSIYQEGSVKYQNIGDVILLNESFYDDQLANILKSDNSYILSSLALDMSKKIESRIVVFSPITSLFNKPKTEEVINLIINRNKNIIDSLSNVLKNKMYLDYSGTSLLEKVNYSTANIKFLKNALNTVHIKYKTDFPNQEILFNYQIGKINSIKYESPNEIVIDCINSVPVISKTFLSKVGVPESKINESELMNQSVALQKIARKAEIKHKQDIKNQEDRLNKGIFEQRKNYRKDFYIRWYSTLILLLNSIIFILLLVRYWIIISQRKLPRKSTDIIYYATNRTSRFFRVIALIITAIAILRIGIGFILYLITIQKLMPIPLIALPLNNPFIFALLTPPIIFVATILLTWLFILNSEWIDFISNCYEVVFHKAYERKITEDKKSNK